MHIMSLLCISFTALNAANKPHETDASLVARSITSHIKSALDSQLTIIAKEIKKSTKQINHHAKQEMRDAQKKIQEKCNEEKKKLYDECALFKKEHLAEQEQDIAHLIAISKKSKKMPTIKALLAHAYEYTDELVRYSKSNRLERSTKELGTAREWFKNIETTSANAGISLTQTIEPTPKKTNKGTIKRELLSA